jgi:16S rRNA (guanine966-N2)-methyltransferase
MLEPYLPDARVLDLFAGSGAGGIEALSRSASAAVMVEHDPGAAGVIAENLRRAGLSERGTIVRMDVVKYLRERATAAGPFDVVLIDPPYAEFQLLDAALEIIGSAPTILRPEAWVVARYFWRTPPAATAGLLTSVRTRRFGETGVVLYRLRVPAEDGSANADRQD